MKSLSALLLALGVGCYSARNADFPALDVEPALRITLSSRNGISLRSVDEIAKSGPRCYYEFRYMFLDDKPSNDIYAVMGGGGTLEEVMMGDVSLPPASVRSESEQELWTAVDRAFRTAMDVYGFLFDGYDSCSDRSGE